MRVARWEKGVYGRAMLCTEGQRDCAQEDSVVVRRRVALYTGGQRDCIQEGSVAMAGCHSLLN